MHFDRQTNDLSDYPFNYLCFICLNVVLIIMKLIMIYSFRYFLLFILFAIVSCTNEQDESGEGKIFRVITPIRIDTAYSNNYVADIHSYQNVEIRSRVKGYLDEILIDEGQHVKAGQKLFSIGKLRYTEELAKAQAALKSAIAEAKAAELKVKNVEILLNKKIVSESELEIQKANLDAANANVDVARSNESAASINLSLTDIRAPFDGIVNRIPKKTGSLIGEETLLTTISDNKEVYVYFNMSEREYLNYLAEKDNETGKVVDLVMANEQLYPHKGVIQTVEGEFDKSTGNIAFRALFPNPEGVLKNGASGNIIYKEKLKDVLVIPQKSTFEIQDKVFVYALDETNTVRMKQISTGYRFQYFYVVKSGLSEKDRILYEGTQLVKEGDKITPENTSYQKIFNSGTDSL